MPNLYRRLPAAAIFLAVIYLTPAALLAQNDPRSALLEEAAWKALKAGDAHEAAEQFRAALASDPRNAQLHMGAGLSAYLERRDADARLALERALALDASLTEARALLARVQYRMGDARLAIGTLEVVVAQTPSDTAIRDLLERWRREVELHDRMQQAVGVHFTVSFEGPAEEQIANEAMAALDRAYWRIGTILGMFPNMPIAVVLYTQEQFRDITRSPSWAAASFDGTIRVPVRGALENSGDLDRVLAHEFTHALVREFAPRGVPAWLNEGLASTLEADGPAVPDERASGDHPAIAVQQLPATFGGLDTAQAQVAYAMSALAVRRLLDEAGGAAVANLLRDLGEGTDLEVAFLHRTGRELKTWTIQ